MTVPISELEALAGDLLKDLSAGGLVPLPEKSLARVLEFADAVIAEQRKRKAASRILSHHMSIKIAERLKQLDISDLTPADVARWVEVLAQVEAMTLKGELI